MPASVPSNATTVPVVVVDSSGVASPIALVETELAQAAVGVAAAITATLAAAAGKTTFISGFHVDGLGATAASVIEVTVTGLLGGTLVRKMTIPAGVAAAVTPLIMDFGRSIPASAVNTAIVVNVPSFGAGNTNAVVEAHGFSK